VFLEILKLTVATAPEEVGHHVPAKVAQQKLNRQHLLQ